MSWGAVISLIGIGAQIIGGRQQASAAEDQASAQAASIAEVAAHNATISKYDATVARSGAQAAYYKTNRELANARQTGDLFLSTQRARFGKSGVAVGTGTPLETMARTYDEFLEDEKIIRYEGLKDVQRAESLASRYDQLADFGLRDAAAQASLVVQSGQDRSTAAYITGVSQVASQTYDLGYNQGWWN